jgi:hypothetical protein
MANPTKGNDRKIMVQKNINDKYLYLADIALPPYDELKRNYHLKVGGMK